MKIEFDKPKIMQLNITKKCNMTCYHCHVEANPSRTEVMSKEIVDKAYAVFKKFGFTSLDITGGAPEMNEHLEYIIKLFKVQEKHLLRTKEKMLNFYKKEFNEAREKYLKMYMAPPRENISTSLSFLRRES